MEGVSPAEPFSRMIIRQRLSKEEKNKVQQEFKNEAKAKGIRYKKEKEFGDLDPV